MPLTILHTYSCKGTCLGREIHKLRMAYMHVGTSTFYHDIHAINIHLIHVGLPNTNAKQKNLTTLSLSVVVSMTILI